MDDSDIDEAYRLFTEKRDVYGYPEGTAFRDALTEALGYLNAQMAEMASAMSAMEHHMWERANPPAPATTG